MIEGLMTSNMITIGRIYLPVEIVDIREAIEEEALLSVLMLTEGIFDPDSIKKLHRLKEQLVSLEEEWIAGLIN